MKKIALENGGYALVDNADYKKVMRYTWRWYKKHKVIYIRSVQSPQVYMHQIVLPHGGAHTDHKNGDATDNRRRNLRPATVKENVRNSTKHGMRGGKPTSSKYKGVYIDRRKRPLSKPWMARICVDRVSRNLGRYATQEEAAKAYDIGAREHFGEFARLNFPRKGEQGVLDEARRKRDEQDAADAAKTEYR